MKGADEVITEFNQVVNMTAGELEKWLKSDDSNSAGWSKDDGDDESVGHDSGRQITEILKANPEKDPKKYTEGQIDHMRKVVSYCKRHLAQENKVNEKKSAAEVKKTKSYASLKNWGHDPLKERGEKQEDGGKPEKETEEKENGEGEEGQNGKQAGDKRKKTDTQSGANKSRKTSQDVEKADDDVDENGQDDENEQEDESSNKEDGEDKGQKQTHSNGSNGNTKQETSGTNGNANGKPKNGPQPGDTVSWNWGNGQPEGKVLDVKGEKTSVQTKRGNEVSRDGDPEDPAVVLDTGKSKAIKLNHELN